MEQPKVIITMTSWKMRINEVSKCIYHFLTRQIEKPDIFYLWLSEDEFPNKEKDLPENLLLIIESFNVKLCWLKENEYNFKRWHVYPNHYNDLVISIDDDILFDERLVLEAKKHINETNIIYGIFKDLMYEYKFNKFNTFNFDITDKSSLKYRFLGCSVITPKSFPLEAVDNTNNEIRKKICKRCDECWIKPFTLLHNTPISFLNFVYNRRFENKKLQQYATWKHLCKRYDGYSVRDYQMFINLYYFPENMKKFKEIFTDYNNSYFEHIGISKCLKILKDNGNLYEF